MSAQAVALECAQVNPTDMVHTICECAPRLALCGAEVRGVETADALECAVCDDLENEPCSRCGI